MRVPRIITTLLLLLLLAAGCATEPATIEDTTMIANQTNQNTPQQYTLTPEEQQDYLAKISAYIKNNEINVAPGDPDQYNIRTAQDVEYEGKQVLGLYLDCCFLGDVAYVDKQTKEVIGFTTGPK